MHREYFIALSNALFADGAMINRTALNALVVLLNKTDNNDIAEQVIAKSQKAHLSYYTMPQDKEIK